MVIISVFCYKNAHVKEKNDHMGILRVLVCIDTLIGWVRGV